MRTGIPFLGLLWFCLQVDLFQCDPTPVIKEIRDDRQPKSLAVSTNEINAAFIKAYKKLERTREIENDLEDIGGITSKDTISSEARHQGSGGNFRTVEINLNAELFEEASKEIVKRRYLDKDEIVLGLPNVQLPQGSREALKAINSCQRIFPNISCQSSVYRTADGTCNNLQNPYWGSSMSCLNRILDPDYSDLVGSPRRSKTKRQLPNPRNLSVNIHNDMNVEDKSITLMVMQWAQFLDHDMTLTPMIRTEKDMDIINCCTDELNKHPACIKIDIPSNDYFYGSQDKRCINLVRSSTCNSNCRLGYRDQVGILTAFIDGSNVYGSSREHTDYLRSFNGGQLRMQDSGTLPEEPLDDNKQCTKDKDQFPCFVSGDERVNEQPGLTSMHIIWLKQHNRIAKELQTLDPTLSEEILFQLAKKIVGAQMQSITYRDFLYVVLGPGYLDFFDLTLQQTGSTYDPSLNPSIFVDFSTAAYRFGHTLIQGMFQQLNLSENFFNVDALKRGQAPSIMQSLSRNLSQKFDRHVVEAVTNNLYKPTGSPFGLDLVAINIQRGRDHGLPGYIHYLKLFFHNEIIEFRDLEFFMETQNWQRLQQNYKNVGDIDLFVGGLNERPVGGAVVGPTFACILGVQFRHLKFGDRYFFEHRYGPNIMPFTDSQRYEVKKTSLAEVICYNANIKNIRQDVFRTATSEVPCKSLTKPDWRVFLPSNQNSK